MKEEATRTLVRQVIAHAKVFYKARTKGLVQRLGALGFTGYKGTYTRQAIELWGKTGAGMTANAFLALAEDMKLDLNALVYQGQIVNYNPEEDLHAQIRVLQKATTDAQRLLDLATGPDK